MKKTKRVVDIVVISDIHLGTYGCHAKELLHYLKSIKPKIVVLNGDIVDIWQFSKNYWPKSHMKIVKYLVGWISKGVKTYYVTGNHDEMFRNFVGLRMGSVRIVNKVILDLPGDKKAWIFHGDVFDVTMQHSKWLVKLGAVGYDTLILINRLANFISERIFKQGKLSLSKKIKSSVKSAVKLINNFEQTSADIGISNNYDYVICGHIHQPEKKVFTTQHGSTIYLNSGDWVENLSSLECVNGEWNIYRFSNEDRLQMITAENDDEELELNHRQLFSNLFDEFTQMRP